MPGAEHGPGRILPYSIVKMADEDTDPINAAVWLFFAGLIAVVLIIYPFLKRKEGKGGGWLFNSRLSVNYQAILCVDSDFKLL